MTNEEKAAEIADKHKQQCYYAAHGDLDNSFEECYQSAIEAMEWKDEQFSAIINGLPQPIKDLIKTLAK